MNGVKSKRPLTLKILVALLMTMGVIGAISGALLLLSPDGSLMLMPVDILAGSPFGNYLIPGIVLFLFLGVFPLVTSYGLIKRPGWKWAQALNISRRYHWAWTASWAAGVIVLLWLATETVLFGYISFLQPVMTVWSLVIIGLVLTPSVRDYYSVTG